MMHGSRELYSKLVGDAEVATGVARPCPADRLPNKSMTAQMIMTKHLGFKEQGQSPGGLVLEDG